jgi:hypothetical protein
MRNSFKFNFFVKAATFAIICSIFYLASAFVNLSWNPIEFGFWTRVTDAACLLGALFLIIRAEVPAV